MNLAEIAAAVVAGLDALDGGTTLPDGPVRAMTRDPDSLKHVNDETVRCDECGVEYTAGAWPFCKGDPKGHER